MCCEFETDDIGGFAQASDDALRVIAYTVEACFVHRTVWKLNIHKPLHELVDEKNNGYT